VLTGTADPEALAARAPVMDTLDAGRSARDGPPVDQHFDEIGIPPRLCQLKCGLAVLAPGVGIRSVGQKEPRHFGCGIVLGMVDRREQRTFRSGAEVGPVAAEEHYHGRFPGSRGEVQRRPAIGGSLTNNFGFGVRQLGCPRDVPGRGGFEDVRFVFLRSLGVKEAGGGCGFHQELTSGVCHAAILGGVWRTAQDSAHYFCVSVEATSALKLAD